MAKSRARQMADLLSGSTGTGTIAPALVSDQNNTSTGYFDVPAGTTAQRPNTPIAGSIRYNSTIGKNEVYDADGWTAIASPPVVTSTDVTTLNEFDTTQTLVISGSAFDTTAVGKLVDANGVTKLPTTSTRNSSSQITLTFTGAQLITNSVAEPLDVQVVNGTGLSSSLTQHMYVQGKPAWSTAANLGSYNVGETVSVNLSATDPDGETVTYAVAANNSLPAGVSLATNGALTGSVSGTGPYNSSGVVYTVNINASDTSGNTTTKEFTLTKNWIADTTDIFGDGSCVFHCRFEGNITNSAGGAVPYDNRIQSFPTGLYGQAALMEGSASYPSARTTGVFRTGNGFWISSGKSMSLWVYRPNGTEQTPFYCQGNNANNYTMINMMWSSGAVGYNRSGGWTRQSTITAGQGWNHIVFNWNNGTTSFDVWINGVKETLGSLTFGSSSGGNYETIGAWIDTNYSSPYYVGTTNSGVLFDDFRLFDKNLSDSEVAILYAQGKDL